MGNTHTYGGDAYLSARLWEMGYTVDAVEDVRVTDRVAPDGLRERNHAIEQQIGSAYYRRYPEGVTIGAPATDPIDEALRILYLPLFSPGYGRYKTGLYDALSKAGIVYELDYNEKRAHLAIAIHSFQPHLVISQFHDAGTIDASVLKHLRELAPGAVWVNWCGDYYPENMTSDAMLAMLRHIDLQLVVNAEVLPFYEAHGITAGYWQIGYENVPAELPDMPSHTLLFQGNCYRPERTALGILLREIDPQAGLYGDYWDAVGGSGKTLYDFAQGAALYRNCQIAIADNMYPTGSAFVSNRIFEALANGAFLLHQHVLKLEQYTGLIAGVHYASWSDFNNLREQINYFLAHEDERRQIADAGRAFVRENFSFDAQVRKLFQDLLPRIANERVSAPLHDDKAPVEHPHELAAFADGIER